MMPTRVGPYLIEKRLGSGGMGTVYLGTHVETHKQAAVKVLPASLAREEGFVARFTREIVAMQKLKNPHIVEFYESGVDVEETYYYAMEYVDGVTLTQILRDKKKIPWKETIDFAVQMCVALKSAHDTGIVHRDLKPSNLMINKDGVVKLTDFGVAQVFAATKLTVTGGIIGTAEYMSPEQAQGKRVTRKSDIYALGAVLYVMVTGRPPYSGGTTIEILRKHQFGQYDAPRLYSPDIPLWLEDVISTCLQKDPEKRYPDAYVLSLRLKEIPKKVELSRQEETLNLGSAPNPHLGNTMISASADEDPNAVGGTLMRDLVRAEIVHEQNRYRYFQIFDNVYVLLVILGLSLALIYFWVQNLTPSSERQLAEGKRLFSKGEDYWLSARDYLQPLVDRKPDEYGGEVNDMLNQIEIYSIKKEFTNRAKLKRLEVKDPQRFLRLARESYEAGDRARAESVLRSLEVLLRSSPQHTSLRLAVLSILNDFNQQGDILVNRRDMIQKSLDRADEFWQKNDVGHAREIWQSLITLYAGESTTADLVHTAETKLKQDNPERIRDSVTMPVIIGGVIDTIPDGPLDLKDQAVKP
jgi:serine/threonine-protein kinase